ncbi:MAG: sce7726 family protein [Desulfobulbia bacterium]
MNMKIKLPTTCKPGLSKIFSAAVINELATKGHSSLAVAILKEVGLLREFGPTTLLRDFFDQVHALLFRSYRNEYIYKNAIARKILLGVHSLNTASMLTEFRAGACKADAVVLNGTSTAYEIKSAYDSMDRLTRQIAAYQQVFDRINVITSDSQLDKVAEVVGEDIGLMVLTDRYTIRTMREPASLKMSTKPEVIFDSLRRNEYEQIVTDHFGEVPQVSSARMYQACRELFCSLDPTVAHEAMVAELKKRGNSKRLRDFVLSVPESLTAVSLSCKLGVAGQARFSQLLNTSIGDCLAG